MFLRLTRPVRALRVLILALSTSFVGAMTAHATHSVARDWNELLLESIRRDFARPTVHARNLYHTSAAMWDAWATYDLVAQPVIFAEKHPTTDPNIENWRKEAISFAMYRILRARFATSPGAAVMFPQYDSLMTTLGYNKDFAGTIGGSPAAIGNRIAIAVINFGLSDGSNEQNNYANQFYQPVNPPMVPQLPGNPTMIDPNRWQPLALDFFVDQSGQVVIGGYPAALTPEWGKVSPFSLTKDQATVYHRDNTDWWVYLDPGAPPYFGTPSESDYKWGYELVCAWSSHLDPADGVMIDASPGGIGGAVLPNSVAGYPNFYDILNGGDNGPGHPINPVTGQPYPAQMVPRGDYTRILAEFWADGPSSETPPGHWFSILNYVSDHPSFQKRLEGTGPILGDLEWEVKTYLAMGGAMHDCAVSCWGIKGWYDYVRPVHAIRYLAGLGQCSDPQAANYNAHGIDLIPGYIELVTPATTAFGQKHEHLFGNEGKIAIKAWRGPNYIANPATDVAGVGWILAEEWWPYQRPTFVTPPFPGYTSGHSTYSRAAANVMTLITGSQYFPDGLGEFVAPQNSYLVFEDGPSVTVKLQWASYFDASDQCSLSRIWGGIHPPQDDIPGRNVGQIIGPQAVAQAKKYWDGTACKVTDTVSFYGLGCAGGGGYVPSLTAGGCATPNGNVNLKLSNAAPQSMALITIGLFQSNVSLAGGCSLLTAPVFVFLPVSTGGTTGVAGSGGVSLPSLIPSDAPVGTAVKLQAIVADSANPWGYSTSNGLSILFK